jgi:RNA polymerase sigma-70 factor (ECF subfamily)
MEDENLIIRAKGGDREAFDELYRVYKRPILNYVYRFIGNRHNAEELTQETFIRAYINLHKYEPRAKFSSWLYRIAGNLARNFLRHASYDRRVRPVKADPYADATGEVLSTENIGDRAKKPDEYVQTKEIEVLIQQAIDQLPAHLKEAVILCDIKEFSYEVAAKIMKCRPMTVGSRLWRGRKKLAGLLHYIKNGEEKR